LHYRSGPREQAGAGRAILESLALKQLAWLASTAVGELTGIEPAMRDLHAEEGSAALGPHVDSTIVLAQREVRVSLSISAQMLKAPEQRRVPRPLPPLGALRDAVLSSKVKVSALMGRTRLRVAELRRLSTGDVVLLDRNVHSPIEIRIGGGPAAALAAYPCALGNRILLQTTRAGSQRLNHGG
jgi:flagellar motor switch/type III secretory pathway protein FliN